VADVLCVEGRPDLLSTVVTASSPIVVSVNHQDAVAAVVGMQMTYRRFYELFMQSTSICDDYSGVTGASCNLTCHSDVSPAGLHSY